MASLGSGRLRLFHSWPGPIIRVDAIWLATEPMDMRAGIETALARVVAVFGAAKPHCAYLFANRRANRMKVLMHDGISLMGTNVARVNVAKSGLRVYGFTN
jgi:transposase